MGGTLTELDEWVVILDFPLYAIHNSGLIRNNRTLRVLKGSYASGYLQVTLRRNNENHQRYVHILVAETFIERPDDGYEYEVNHVYGDKSDNGANNLEWVSHGDNMRHALATGLICMRPVTILETGQTFTNATECARYLGVHKTYVTNHLNGRYPTCKGYHLTRE